MICRDRRIEDVRVCACVCVWDIYIYIYIYRERERESRESMLSARLDDFGTIFLPFSFPYYDSATFSSEMSCCYHYAWIESTQRIDMLRYNFIWWGANLTSKPKRVSSSLYWMPHSSTLVPHPSKKLSKLLQVHFSSLLLKHTNS